MKDDLQLVTIYQNTLDMQKFSSMLDKNSQCYKFYWLDALIYLLVEEGKTDFSFAEAAEEMIIDAWYTISEYHLHMGSMYGEESKNAIERAVKYLQSVSELSSSADRTKISLVIDKVKDEPKFQKIISQMTDDVPYRLLSPFVPELKGTDKIWSSDRRVIEYFKLVNSTQPLPYYMEFESQKVKYVHWNDCWAEMVRDNNRIIRGWIRSKKIRYLQDRNPGVPGIVYKLDPVAKRNLTNVHHLWDAIMEKEDVIDIYTNTILNGNRYDIDHFIPWSYVAADELWNLTPSDQKTNRSKSNNLPDWDLYFNAFAVNQTLLHDQICKDNHIRKLFEDCRNSNLNSIWALDLYNTESNDQFKTQLRENMKPVYNAARLQGYRLWTV